MDNELLGELLTYIIADPSDVVFLRGIKEGISYIQPQDMTPEVPILDRFIEDLLTSKIELPREAMRMYVSYGFSDTTKSYVSIISSSKVNRGYKNDLLDRLNATTIVGCLNPIVEVLQDELISLEAGNPGKSRRQYQEDILKYIQSLSDRSIILQRDRAVGNSMIIDPLTGIQNSDAVVEQAEREQSLQIKSIPGIDQLVGNGFRPGTLSMVCCLSGHGKSLIMQNVAIYASINNNPEDLTFKEGRVPCILFVSYEMKLIQLLQRQLSFFGVDKNIIYKIPKEELKDKLNYIMIEEAKRHGVKLPLIYDDQITINENSTGRPTADDIRRSIKRYQMQGYDPVMVIVDYIGLMGVKSRIGQQLGTTGGDISQALSLKAIELRQVAIEYKIPILTAQQLDTEASMMFGQMQAYTKLIDPIVSMGDNMLRGSKQVKDNLEILMYGDVFKIQRPIDPESQDRHIRYDTYVSLDIKKDRDEVARYRLSERDIETADSYKRITEKIRNDAQTRRFFREPEVATCVMPLISGTMKIHPEDYGRSIRTYYCNSMGTQIDLNALKDSNEIDLEFGNAEEEFEATDFE